MEKAELYAEHNSISLYTFGLAQYTLKQGTTEATLRGHYPHLCQGDVLILEEIFAQDIDFQENVKSRYRHAVRLNQPPVLSFDNTHHQNITKITWEPEDGLPSDFQVSWMDDRRDDYRSNLTVARGNIVLADHWMYHNRRIIISCPSARKI